MTAVLLAAAGVGLGLTGIVAGVRRRTPTLASTLAALQADGPTEQRGRRGGPAHPSAWRVDRRAGEVLAGQLRQRGLVGRRWESQLAICDIPLHELCARCILAGAAGALVSPLVWTLIGASGLNLPVDVPLWVILPGVLGGLSLPVWQLRSEARRRHRLAQRVVCSFLDLVVLGLAAGMGIESALVAAAQLGETDVSRKIAAVLSLSRDSGEAPWAALARLGTTLGVDELSEVAAAAALAGTEGARIRATLAARAASIRRHELADAEAEANATTERLFLPGALLLVGFLLFVGYPAFSRISSGL